MSKRTVRAELSAHDDNTAISASFSGDEGVSRIVRADFSDEDAQENKLRPQLLNEFLGQETTKKNLSVFIAAARSREEALDHLFLIGPPGLGKTTLAQITAHDLGADFKIT